MPKFSKVGSRSSSKPIKPKFNSYRSDQRPARPQKPVIVEGVLRSGDIAMIVGGPNAGKSTSAVHLMQSVARGTLWFGRETMQTAVFYCAAEAPEAVEAQEKAWLGHHNEGPVSNIVFCEEEFDLDDELHVKAFIEHVREKEAEWGCRFGIIIFDTNADFLGNVEENSNTEMRKINNALQRIVRELGCCVILIHHYGKDEGRGPRGAQCLNAKLDVRLDCWSEGDLTLLEVGKMRRGRKGDVFAARRQEVVIGVDNFGKPETGCVMIEQSGGASVATVPASLTLEQAILDVVSASPKPLNWSCVRESLKKLGFAIDDAGRVAAERARDRMAAAGPSKRLDYDKKSKLVRLAISPAAVTAVTPQAPAQQTEGAIVAANDDQAPAA